MRKTTRLLAAATIALSGLATHAMAETVTLNVTATPSIFKPMFEAFVEAFEAKNPDIKVNLDASERDQSDMIQALLRRALVNDLPDVTFQGYNYLRVLVDRDLAVSLDSFVMGDPEWSDATFTKSITSSASINDVAYGLGVGMSFPVIYYNPDIVKRAQDGREEMPTTWDGLVDLGHKIGKVEPDALGLLIRAHPWIFQALVESMGGRLMDAQEQAITFSGSEGMAAFDLLRRIGEAGQAAANMTREQGRQAFVSGKVGMLVDSSSSLASFEKQTAGLFEVKTAPLPVLSSKGQIPAAGIASVMLTHDPAVQKAAWKFMKFAVSPEGQVIVGKNTGYVPANGIAAQRADLLGDYYKTQKGMSAALETLPYASLWYAFPGENSAKIDKVVEDYMVKVVTLQQAPKEAMDAMKHDVAALLTE